MSMHLRRTMLTLLSFLTIFHGVTLAAKPNSAEHGEAGKFVRYSDFGAKGDGKTDDMAAIVKAHNYANQHRLKVIAEEGKSYYIGGKKQTAIIQTDTDFNNAHFIIDDTAVENRGASIFTVSSTHPRIRLEGIASLKKNQPKINASLPRESLIQVTNTHQKHYIRQGANQNNGAAQADIFIVNQHGEVNTRTPILWDFKNITHISAHPIDQHKLTVTGGTFTTIANREESKYNYHNRGITIRRSNVVIDGIKHLIKGEGEHGSPYHGFINISGCANVTVQNSAFSGHKTYRTIGSAGRQVSMGSYDLTMSKSANVSFINCRQMNDINDRKLWGIMASNYCKNLIYNNCKLSRFDAHKGVYNAAILNSTIGHAGINAIGHGLLMIKNTTVNRASLVNLRSDYGSTWNGEFIIQNCELRPTTNNLRKLSLISGSYSGQHDFGYSCHMPSRITIKGLRINDAKHHKDYRGPTLFSNFNSRYTSDTYVEKFPYLKTEEVILKNVTTSSGKALRISDNLFMFKQVQVKR